LAIKFPACIYYLLNAYVIDIVSRTCQGANRGQRGAFGFLGLHFLSFLSAETRQIDKERTALFEFALNPDPAAVQFDNLTANEKT
jgi:hypothetical protein